MKISADVSGANLANSLSHGRVRFQFFLNEGLFFLSLIDSLSLGITDSEKDVDNVSIVLFFFLFQYQ